MCEVRARRVFMSRVHPIVIDSTLTVGLCNRLLDIGAYLSFVDLKNTIPNICTAWKHHNTLCTSAVVQSAPCRFTVPTDMLLFKKI